MRKTRIPMLFCDHVKLAADLKRIKKELNDIAFKCFAAYGSSSKSGKFALRMTGKIDAMRSDMEDRMFSDCPSEASIKVYYGNHSNP
jgi:hypothetical protein